MRNLFHWLHATAARLLLIVAFPASLTELHAQADGTPIRIQTVGSKGHWVTGQAVGITADSVGVLRSSGNVVTRSYDTLRYARTELHRMEVSAGRKSNAGRGALIGGGILGGLGIVLGAACAADTDENDYVGCEAGDVPLYGLAGAATGAALGALIGAMSHSERWRAVELGPDTEADER